MLRRILAALAAVLLASGPALGADPASAARFVSLTFENDFFVGFDRHYTNGVQLAVSVDPATMPLGPLRGRGGQDLVVAAGQRIYTPADTDRVHPDPHDRPYAGWLYAMADLSSRRANAVDHVLAVAGVVGPSALARQTQNGMHSLLREAASRGWDAQLHDEPTFLVGFERAWPAVASATLGAAQLDASLRAGATVGTPLTYANAGTVVRIGRNLPADLPVTGISLAPSRDGYQGTRRSGWYAWLGVDARAVAYNTFLDGNASAGGPSVDRMPFGYDIQLGLAVAWPDMRLGFTVVERSREFRGQDKPDRFAQLTASQAF